MTERHAKKNNEKLRVGVLGCSTVSQMAQLQAAVTAENVDLMAVCDGSKDLRWKVAAMFEPKKLYSSYQEMLDDPDIDAVVIGVPDRFHADSALQAVLAGKHVMVEQPMGLSVEECETLMEIGHRKHQVVHVSSVRRFDPGIAFAREYVEKNLGKILSFEGWYSESSDYKASIQNLHSAMVPTDGVRKMLYAPGPQQFLFQQAVNAVDTAVYLLGEIATVSVHEQVLEDMYSWHCILHFENHAIGSFALNYNIRGNRQEGFRIYGSEGLIHAVCHSPWEYRTTELSCQSLSSGQIVSPKDTDGQLYRRQMESFAEVILAGKKISQTGAGLREGIHVLQVLLAMLESAAQGGRSMVVKEAKNRTSI